MARSLLRASTSQKVSCRRPGAASWVFVGGDGEWVGGVEDVWGIHVWRGGNLRLLSAFRIQDTWVQTRWLWDLVVSTLYSSHISYNDSLYMPSYLQCVEIGCASPLVMDMGGTSVRSPLTWADIIQQDPVHHMASVRAIHWHFCWLLPVPTDLVNCHQKNWCYLFNYTHTHTL